jgi:hypothetical protein
MPNLQAYRIWTTKAYINFYRTRQPSRDDVRLHLLNGLIANTSRQIEQVRQMPITHKCCNSKIWPHNNHDGIEALIQQRHINRLENILCEYKTQLTTVPVITRLVNIIQTSSSEYKFSFHFIDIPSPSSNNHQLETGKLLTTMGAAFRSVGRTQIDHSLLLAMNNIQKHSHHLTAIAKSAFDVNTTAEHVQTLQKQIRAVVQNIVGVLDSFPPDEVVEQIRSDCCGLLAVINPVPQSVYWMKCVIERARFVLLRGQIAEPVIDDISMWLVSAVSMAVMDMLGDSHNGGKIVNYIYTVGLLVMFSGKLNTTILKSVKIYFGKKLSFLPDGAGYSLTIPCTHPHDPDRHIAVRSATDACELAEWKKSNRKWLRAHNSPWKFNDKHSLTKQLSELHRSQFRSPAFISIVNGKAKETFADVEFDLMQDYGVYILN